jgi:hypothetical protein
LIMVVVNEAVNNPSTKYDAARCTRYCHNVTCEHGNKLYEKHQGSWFADFTKNIYTKNIVWLHNNPFGIGYGAVNLLIYVFAWPLLMALLLGNLIRKS